MECYCLTEEDNLVSTKMHSNQGNWCWKHRSNQNQNYRSSLWLTVLFICLDYEIACRDFSLLRSITEQSMQSICSNNGKINLDLSQHDTQGFHELAQGGIVSFLLKGWKAICLWAREERGTIEMGLWYLHSYYFLHFKIINPNIKQNPSLWVK